MANLQPTWRVSDFATGGGHTTLTLSPHVEHIIACDFSDPMLEAAWENRKRQGQDNIKFCLNDAEILPYPTADFELGLAGWPHTTSQLFLASSW